MRSALLRFLVLSSVVFLAAAAPKESENIPAPDFKAFDLDKIPVELSSFKGKQPVVLFFWTTWCPYCRKAVKQLNRDIDGLNKEGITVIPLNSGEPEAKVAKFVKDNGLNLRVFLDPDSQISDTYHVYGIPLYYIVDKNGNLLSAHNSFPLEEARQLSGEK